MDARQQVDLLDVAASPWAGAASCIAGAVLFLDAGAAAAAASAGGAPLLFCLGAQAVLDLEAATADAAASSGDGTQPVCVVVTLPLDACLEEVAARVEVCVWLVVAECAQETHSRCRTRAAADAPGCSARDPPVRRARIGAETRLV
jgi:hypothetical protein